MVTFISEGRLRWVIGIGVVRFSGKILAGGILDSESDEASMSASS